MGTHDKPQKCVTIWVAFVGQERFLSAFVVDMAGLPVHPSMVGQQAVGFVTPPQDRGERHTTHENIIKFFDKNTYRRGVVPKTSGSPVVHGQNTKETIHNIHREGSSASETCQKRSSSSEASGSQSTRPAKLPKTMTQEELLEKFKLAASLNGLSWDDIGVTRTLLNKLNNLLFASHLRDVNHISTDMINKSSSRLPAKADIATTCAPSSASIPASSQPPADELDGQELSDQELAELEAEVEAELNKMVFESQPPIAEQVHPPQAVVPDPHELQHPSVVAQAGQVQGQHQTGQGQPVVAQAGQVQPVVAQAGQVFKGNKIKLDKVKRWCLKLDKFNQWWLKMDKFKGNNIKLDKVKRWWPKLDKFKGKNIKLDKFNRSWPQLDKFKGNNIKLDKVNRW